MEFNFKFDKKMLVETANHVLDGYEYKGKTIREWADLIANPKTNADRIRGMPDEELADYLRYYSDSYARYDMDWLDWLKCEVKENE